MFRFIYVHYTHKRVENHCIEFPFFSYWNTNNSIKEINVYKRKCYYSFRICVAPISALRAFLFYYGYGYSTTHTIVYTVLYDWLRIYSCASIKREGKSADDPYPSSKSLAFCLFSISAAAESSGNEWKKRRKKNKIVGHQSGSESLLSLENYPANNKDVLQRFTRRVYT